MRHGINFQNCEQFDTEAVKYALELQLTANGLPPQRDRRDGPYRGDRSDDRAGGDEAGILAIRRQRDRAGMMLPPKATEAGGKEFGLLPVCSGPFWRSETVAGIGAESGLRYAG